VHAVPDERENLHLSLLPSSLPFAPRPAQRNRTVKGPAGARDDTSGSGGSDQHPTPSSRGSPTWLDCATSPLAPTAATIPATPRQEALHGGCYPPRRPGARARPARGLG